MGAGTHGCAGSGGGGCGGGVGGGVFGEEDAVVRMRADTSGRFTETEGSGREATTVSGSLDTGWRGAVRLYRRGLGDMSGWARTREWRRRPR